MDQSEINVESLPIVQIGHPVLRTCARSLTLAEIHSPEIQQLIYQMKTTMHQAPGVGLAAPQVGLPVQLIVIEDKQDYFTQLTEKEIRERDRRPIPFHVLINPKLIVDDKDKQVEFYEGCLSMKGFTGEVSRALTVTVEALNEKGEPITIHASGWYARILQHEVDHLHGILCVDHTKPKTLTTLENYKNFHRSP